MSSQRDYYEVLGISRSSNEKQIKSAYRKLAMKFHPDAYEGPKVEGEAKFKEINEAYSILSDPKKRQTYDQFGHAGLKGQGGMGFDPMDIFSSVFSGGGGGGFGGSIFDSFFGGGQRSRQSRGPRKGEDVVLALNLSLEEAYEGVSKKVRMPFQKACGSCLGSRAEKGSKSKTCRTCQGRGIVEKQQRSGFFVQISQEPCNTCKGSGEVPEKRCKICKGSGLSNTREEITVRIPPGIDSDEAVRVQGKGRPSNNGGMPGDLMFQIRIKEHTYFIRDGNDVYQKIEVNFPTLAIGGELQVNIIGGKDEKNKATLKIPKGTQHNEILTIRNKGIHRKVRGNDVKGHMRYVVQLTIPKKVTKAQEKLLSELQSITK